MEKQERLEWKFCFSCENLLPVGDWAGLSLCEAGHTKRRWPLKPAWLRCQHNRKKVISSEVFELILKKKGRQNIGVEGKEAKGKVHPGEQKQRKIRIHSFIHSFINSAPVSTGMILGTKVIKINKPWSVSPSGEGRAVLFPKGSTGN